MSIIKGLSDFMKNQLLPAPKYVGLADGIFGNTRRKPRIGRRLTIQELNLLRKVPEPLTKEQKLKRVQNQINDTIKLILHHEKAMQTCGEELADLIQKQKKLETTR